MDEVDRLRLDDQLCFALYAATNAITRRYRPLLGRLGLTYPQYLVMLVLWQDGPCSVGEVARRLELEPHAVGPLVTRLATAGLVQRRPGADRRRTVVSLTDAGRALEAGAARVQAEVACATGLDPDGLHALRRRLRALAAELADTGPAATMTPPRRPGRGSTAVEGDAS